MNWGLRQHSWRSLSIAMFAASDGRVLNLGSSTAYFVEKPRFCTFLFYLNRE